MCQGLEAVPTHTLHTIPGKYPMSWDISPDALHVVVGYKTGHLQVHIKHRLWVGWYQHLHVYHILSVHVHVVT